MKEKISITLDKKLIKEVDSVIDGIRIRNKSQAIEFLLRKSLSEKKICVILAGGNEGKLKVGNVFKPLVHVGRYSVIELMIKNLKKHKFNDIVIVGRKHILSDIFKKIGDGSELGVTINFVEEREEPSVTSIDTARTLKTLKNKLKRPFLCMNCDIVFDYDLDTVWNFHIKNNGIATLILKTTNNPEKYSVVEMEGNIINKFVEKPKKSESYLVYTGMFVAEPEILSQAGTSLEYDVFPQLANNGLLLGYVCSGKSEHIH